jgi:hypothetical protein
LRFSYRARTGRTQDKHVEQLQHFAAAVGDPLIESSVRGAHTGIWKFFDGKYGDTKTTIDLYFTSEGVANIAKSDAFRAYGRALTEMEGTRGPAWARDTDAPAALRMIHSYEKSDDDALAEKYRRQFGRDLEDDLEKLKAARRFTRAVSKLGELPAEKRTQVLKELGDDTGLDFWTTLAALTHCAGRQGYLVHNLVMLGDDGDDLVRIIGRDEGVVHGMDLVELMTQPAGAIIGTAGAGAAYDGGAVAQGNNRLLPWARK